MSDDARFDPRFDPAFQPGYDGPLATPGPASRADPAPGQSERAGAPALPTAEPAEEEVPGPEGQPSRRVNPFLIALGLVALLLLSVGLSLVARLPDMFADIRSSTSVDYVTLQVLMFAAPMIIVLGLATAVGLLFVFAIRWDRR